MEFLQQKAKIDWITNGDENTQIFHQILKYREQKNAIYSIIDGDGIWRDDHSEMKNAFLSFYKQLLGSTMASRKHVNQRIVDMGPVLTEEHHLMLRRNITAEEVKTAMFSIGNDKSYGWLWE